MLLADMLMDFDFSTFHICLYSCDYLFQSDDDNNMQWPEALKFLFECASSENPVLKESALHILRLVFTSEWKQFETVDLITKHGIDVIWSF